MQPILRTQISEININKGYDKIKSIKDNKLKDVLRLDKNKKDK